MNKSFEYVCDDCEMPIKGEMYCLKIKGVLQNICKTCFDKLRKK